MSSATDYEQERKPITCHAISSATDYEHERKSTSQLVSSAMTPAP